jgi:hypothetical protein
MLPCFGMVARGGMIFSCGCAQHALLLLACTEVQSVLGGECSASAYEVWLLRIPAGSIDVGCQFYRC